MTFPLEHLPLRSLSEVDEMKQHEKRFLCRVVDESSVLRFDVDASAIERRVLGYFTTPAPNEWIDDNPAASFKDEDK